MISERCEMNRKGGAYEMMSSFLKAPYRHLSDAESGFVDTFDENA